MEELIKLLEDIREGIDYLEVDNLITGGYLDSLDLLNIIAEIEERFEIDIMPNDINPLNFDSAEAMWKLILGKK